MAFLTKKKCKKDGKTYESDIWYVGYTVNGKQFLKSTFTKIKSDAEHIRKTKYIPLEVNDKNKVNVVPINMKLVDALNEFKEGDLKKSKQLGKQKAKKSIQRDEAIVENFKKFLGGKSISEYHEIRKETIEQYIDDYCMKEQKKKQNTLRRELQVVKAFFHWSSKKYYINEADNPCNQITNIQKSKKAPRFFNEEEIEKIFASAKEPQLFMFKLMYYTGMRIQELLNTTWNDYIPKSDLIIVRGDTEGNKTKRETYVHLSKKAKKIMEMLREKKGDNFYVFTNELGNQYDQSKIYEYAKKLYKRLEILNVNQPLHCWRSTCASLLVQRGVPIFTVAQILRHSDLKEVMTYAFLNQETIEKAIEKL